MFDLLFLRIPSTTSRLVLSFDGSKLGRIPSLQLRSPTGRNALAVTERVRSVVEGQDPILGVVGLPVLGHTATCAAAVLKDLIGQVANVGKLQGCTLREEADATGTEADVSRDTEAAAQTVGLSAGFASESDGVGLGDADDVVAIIVGC